jgi:hypothetical protein
VTRELSVFVRFRCIRFQLFMDLDPYSLSQSVYMIFP